MSGKPTLLDAFCGAGGAARGYADAGFDVTGVDIKPQARYPYRFIPGDALGYIRDHGHEYDAIHASPPCQGYSAMASMVHTAAPRLIEATRAALLGTGRPFVIENVEQAPLRDAVTLCGTMFGLRVRRHRLFELRPALQLLTPPCACRNGVRDGRLIGHRVAGRETRGRVQPPRHTESERRDAIGVPWMTARAARQAIPPAYTRFIGTALLSATLEGGRCLAG